MNIERGTCLKCRAGRAGILVHWGAVTVVVAEDATEERR